MAEKKKVKPPVEQIVDTEARKKALKVALDQITKQFPFIGTLLKKNQDIDTFESYKRGRGRFR